MTTNGQCPAVNGFRSISTNGSATPSIGMNVLHNDFNDVNQESIKINVSNGGDHPPILVGGGGGCPFGNGGGVSFGYGNFPKLNESTSREIPKGGMLYGEYLHVSF